MDAFRGFYVAPKETDNTPSLCGVPPGVFRNHTKTCTARPDVQSWEASINRSATNGCLLCALWLQAIRATATSDCFQWTSHYLDIYTISSESTHIPNIIQGKSPSGNTGSVTALRFFEEQIKYCLSNHSSCGHGRETFLPTRVLDISNSTDLHLKEGAGDSGRYAALSHAWGGKISLQTTSTTLESHSKGIPFDRLPKSFQDAIDFCQKIELRYLWIDSLCIIQDDLSDWQRELTQMKEIYSNAFIVVAATASSNGDGGCYQVKKDSRKRVAQVQCGTSLVDVYARRHWRHVNPINYSRRFSQMTCPPLMKRAWVFQERLLSARVIHFTMDEVIWECREMEACECLMTKTAYQFKAGVDSKQTIQTHLKEGFPPNLVASQDLPLLAHWGLLVGDYSELSISFAKDRLPALSGVARSFHNLGLGNYYAGLWERNLKNCLAWRAYEPRGRRLDNYSPSWSWSSISSAVCYDSSKENSGSVLSVQCDLVGEDAFGEVRGGKIVLEVDLVPAQLVPVKILNPSQQIINERGTLPPVGVALKGKAFHVSWDTNECYDWSIADILDEPVGEGAPSNLTSIETRYTLSQEQSGPLLYAFHIASHPGRVLHYYLILICENEEENLFRRVGFMKDGVKTETIDILLPQSSRFPFLKAVMDKNGGVTRVITII